MAKELPYFQFEPAAYLTGNIQFCSYEEQGVYINVCSMYWQRSCDITKDQLVRKFGADNVNRLIVEGVIKVRKDDDVFIEFLDEQWSRISDSKKILSDAGKKGALIKKQATLKPPLKKTEAPLKQLEEIREDKNKGENKPYLSISDFESQGYTFGLSEIATDSINDFLKYRHERKEPITSGQVVEKILKDICSRSVVDDDLVKMIDYTISKSAKNVITDIEIKPQVIVKKKTDADSW